MDKVVTINLNGNAYQLDEGGCEQLGAYLERAAAQLRDNPDRVEIIADLEQAIAEKCARYLAPHKTVVTADEVRQILAEMGPVHDPASDPDAEKEPAGEKREERTTTSAPAPKRLYRIRDGAMLTGVCAGLAAYFNSDVNIVRVAFVVLTVLTKGIWALIYAGMSMVIPEATTAEERAAAHGIPFSAQHMIDRAKENYRNFRTSPAWRRQRARWRREWRRTFRSGAVQGSTAAPGPDAYAIQVWAGVVTPFLSLAQAGLLVVLALAVMSLVDDGDVFGWMPPPEVPLWAGVLGLVIAYNIAASPFRAAQAALMRHRSSLVDASSGLLTLAITAFFLWLAYQNIPEVRQFVRDLPDIWLSIKESFGR